MKEAHNFVLQRRDMAREAFAGKKAEWKGLFGEKFDEHIRFLAAEIRERT